MSSVRVHSFTISLDGYAAGPDRSVDAPLGVGGEALHRWAFAIRTFRANLAMQGGTTFHFVTDGIHGAMEQARDAAGGADVRVGSGPATIRQPLPATRRGRSTRAATVPPPTRRWASRKGGGPRSISSSSTCRSPPAAEPDLHARGRRAGAVA